MQASVLYDRETGHVFALATAAAPLPEPDPEKPEETAAALRALAGAALPTRGYLDFDATSFVKTEFTIPATRLALERLGELWSVGLVLMERNCPSYLRVDPDGVMNPGKLGL